MDLSPGQKEAQRQRREVEQRGPEDVPEMHSSRLPMAATDGWQSATGLSMAPRLGSGMAQLRSVWTAPSWLRSGRGSLRGQGRSRHGRQGAPMRSKRTGTSESLGGPWPSRAGERQAIQVTGLPGSRAKTGAKEQKHLQGSAEKKARPHRRPLPPELGGSSGVEEPSKGSCRQKRRAVGTLWLTRRAPQHDGHSVS